MPEVGNAQTLSVTNKFFSSEKFCATTARYSPKRRIRLRLFISNEIRAGVFLPEVFASLNARGGERADAFGHR